MASLDARIAKLEENRPLSVRGMTDEQLDEIIGPIAPALHALLQARGVIELVEMHERFQLGADTGDDRELILQMPDGAMEALALVASIDAST